MIFGRIGTLPFKVCKHCGAAYYNGTHMCPVGTKPRPETRTGATPQAQRPIRTAIIPKVAD